MSTQSMDTAQLLEDAARALGAYQARVESENNWWALELDTSQTPELNDVRDALFAAESTGDEAAKKERARIEVEAAKASSRRRAQLLLNAPDAGAVMDKCLGDLNASEEILEITRQAWLGNSGLFRAAFAELAKSPPDQRPKLASRLNTLKARMEEAVAIAKARYAEAGLEAKLRAERVDVTLPAPPTPRGAIHPISQVMEEMASIFADMGFTLEEGPDIETDFNNFTALNFPAQHPARDAHDTFFFAADAKGERKLLRTHTSPVQVRTMLKQKPPIRMICQGRTYRVDSDATHTPMFHQMEGLAIDERTNMADLKGVLMAFVRAFFEIDEIEVRFRPHFFPFTEPSAEMDVRCDRSGDQIRIGAGDDWLEILGCGMVHPNVLKNCGLDPEKYQGWAFGMGVDRLAGLKYGMPDLREYFTGDTRWLKHYGFSPYLLPGLAGGLG